MGDSTIPTSVHVASRPLTRRVSLSPTCRSGSSSRTFAVATRAFPSVGRSQRPSWSLGLTIVVSVGSPKVMKDRLSDASGRIRWVDAKRQVSAAVTPGTRSASASSMSARPGAASSTWTS